MEEKRLIQFNTIATILVFVLFITAFFVAGFLKKDGYFSEAENRYLEQKPKMSVKTVLSGEFSGKYETYITDQFVFRNQWISIKSFAEMMLAKKDINGVYLAKDDYLIEMHQDIDTEKAKQNSERVISFVQKEMEALGKDRVNLMVVPTAVCTLKDKLPAFATTFDQDAYIHEMKSQLGDAFIDVRDTLNKHAGETLYYRTDHHWTTLGAFYAYETWAEAKNITALSKDDFTVTDVTDEFLGTIYSKVNFAKKKDTIQIFEPRMNCRYEVDINMGEKKHDTLYIRDYLEKKDKYGMFLDGNNALVTIQTQTENLGQTRYEDRNLLIIKDSYAHCMVPFLTNHYSNIVVLDLRYCKMPVSKIMEQYQITDILVLYNAIHFAQENNFALLNY